MQLSTDQSHHFEILRILGRTYRGGADVQEVLQVAAALPAGDDEAWFTHWHGLAERVKTAGDKSLERGHRLSAAQSYLRASTYYMFEDFYLHGNQSDPRIKESGRMSRWCFLAAAPALEHDIERVEIPYEDATLPAYVIKKRGAGNTPAPTLICHTGFDGTKEETAIWPGFAAAERGYTVISFDGPGQGEVIREMGIPFRGDWQNVVTPVVDYALSRADVDPEKLSLMGISLGGVLAPIAASHEHRLKALIANGGLYSYAEIVGGRIPEEVRKDPQKLKVVLKELFQTNTTVRWAINHGLYAFGARDFLDYVEKVKPLVADKAADIRCNTLVLDAELEGFFAGQPKKLYDKLTCKKTYMHFSVAEAAGAHCQAGAEAIGSARIFDWLDEALGVRA